MSGHSVKPSGVLGGLAGLLGLSVIAGVLVAVMVTPALAVTGNAAKGTIGAFQDLPEFIRLSTQSQQNQIYAMRTGQPVLIATTFKQNRKEVDWEQVSPFLTQAVVAGEDRRFYEHGGVDISSIARAAIGNAQSGQVTSGGSTLDMQLVKNILIQEAQSITDTKKRDTAVNAAKETSIDRKIKEMKLAIGLDKEYTKKEILLGYLNIVGMGSNTYGVESAAQQYFSVPAKDVTLPQAASLIAIVQQPNAQNLSDPAKYPANKIRRDEILDAMLDVKYIDQKQHDDAIATTIESYVKISPPISGCRNAADAKVACDYVTRLITAPELPAGMGAAPVVESLGATPSERSANWDKGGYTVFTSIDLGLQDAAQDALNTQTPPTENRFPLGAASNTVEAGTGRVLAMAQNKPFDDALEAAPNSTALNLSTDFPYGNSVGFETGSTYKIIDLANWLDTGHGLNDRVNGTGPQIYAPSRFSAPCDPGAIPGAPFKLQNDGNSRGGYMTVRSALIGSVNNAFMDMATRQDLCSIRETAKAMGAHRADFKKDLDINPSTILGSNEQAPLTMAAVAATIGAGGLHCTPIIIDKIVDPQGKELPGQAKTCNQAFSADVAAGVANAMAGSMAGGTSRPGNPRDGVPIGGKTGTSPSSHQDWIVATTTKLGTAVWTGNIYGNVGLKRFTNPITRQNYYSSSRFNIMKAVMKTANALPGLRGEAFPAASAAILGGSSATVPSVIGQTMAQAKALLESLQFEFVDGGPVASALPAGRVVSTDPAPGAKVSSGNAVTVFSSDGSLATTMPNVVGLTRQAANDALAAAGFAPENVSYTWVQGTPGPPANLCQVQASNPAAGAVVAKTDAVTLNVYGTAVANPSGEFRPPPGVCL
ncbi:transglycosylase domain-containing protein [Glaciihabitans sp. UYNi722]|uniref:transglycosylase domain-containing protein n=1 Tax=Glaciihabitans sp. UYNi722 TaxID=3156344 RepID=UPI0033936BFE